jgi:hypothetical protein
MGFNEQDVAYKTGIDRYKGTCNLHQLRNWGF